MESPRLTHPLYPCSNKDNPFNQIGWLIDSDKNMLVDFIGRLENIDKDYETLSSKLNISYKKVPHLNISNGKKHYISYYTDELKNFVGDMYSEEISLLGYNFGGPNESID